MSQIKQSINQTYANVSSAIEDAKELDGEGWEASFNEGGKYGAVLLGVTNIGKLDKFVDGLSERSNKLDSNTLNNQLAEDAIIYPKTTYGPSVSRGSGIDKNGNLIKSNVFTNLDANKGFLSDNSNRQIAGISKNPDGKTFQITDKDAYINDVKKIYKEEGIDLHPDTEKLIRNEINNKEFIIKEGPPRLHSEVQSLNEIYHKSGGSENLLEIKIGTKYSDGNHADFESCSNCSGIIKQDPSVEIITDK